LENRGAAKTFSVIKSTFSARSLVRTSRKPKPKKQQRQQRQQRQQQIDSVFRAVYGVESWLRPESEKHKLPPIEAFRLATENQVQRLLEARPERFARVRLNWDGNAENKRIKVGLFWRVDGCSDLT
jgi:hypothetical protein